MASIQKLKMKYAMAKKHLKKQAGPSGSNDRYSSLLVLYFYNKFMKPALLNQNLPPIGKECTFLILFSCEKQTRSEFFAMAPSIALYLLNDRHNV